MSAKHFSFVSYRDLRELVDTAAERYPNTEFFISSDKLLPHITGRQLRHCCCAFAHIMRSEGRQGEHIAVLGRNCAAWIAAFFSIVTGGCVAVPLSVDAKGDELDCCVKKADCTTFVYERGSAPEACADAAAAVSIGRSAMECVKLQRYHYSTLISGDVNSRAMRREPELAIADCTERYDELYKKLQNKIK